MAVGGVALGAASAQARVEKAKRIMASSDPFLAYVGCRTSRERNARGDGITVWRVGPNGGWTKIQTVGDLFNPSWLGFDRTKRRLYAVHGDASEISAFRIGADGKLTFLNRQSTQGKNPVHLAVDPSNRFVVVANHVTQDGFVSNVAVLPLGQDGALQPVVDMVKLEGKIGPHRVEQPFPKPHQAEFDPSGRWVIVPDKGCDLVRVYSLGADGKLAASPAPPAVAREGSGPRHVALHPSKPWAYLVNELDSTVVAYRFDPAKGSLAPFQVLPSLPDTFTGDSRASEIALSADGRFLYASNRGQDSVAVFRIHPTSGRLTPIEWAASGGKTPRFFALSPNGQRLYAANEDSDSIVAFRIDAAGLLSEAGQQIKTGSPTCIVFSDPKRA
jgi:6-phosphogluconolactonase (cycloisomerase 2 family)